jgi:hypothetical protein
MSDCKSALQPFPQQSLKPLSSRSFNGNQRDIQSLLTAHSCSLPSTFRHTSTSYCPSGLLDLTKETVRHHVAPRLHLHHLLFAFTYSDPSSAPRSARSCSHRSCSLRNLGFERVGIMGSGTRACSPAVRRLGFFAMLLLQTTTRRNLRNLLERNSAGLERVSGIKICSMLTCRYQNHEKLALSD